MPKYYCDYCDTFLTHDSPSVRKTHCGGRKHKDNVCAYYQKLYDDELQKLVDITTAAFTAGKLPTNQYMNGPGPMGAMIPPPMNGFPPMGPMPGMGGPPGSMLLPGGPMFVPGMPMRHPMGGYMPPGMPPMPPGMGGMQPGMMPMCGPPMNPPNMMPPVGMNPPPPQLQ